MRRAVSGYALAHLPCKKKVGGGQRVEQATRRLVVTVGAAGVLGIERQPHPHGPAAASR